MSNFDNNKLAEEVVNKVENSKVLKTIDEVKEAFGQIQKSITHVGDLINQIAKTTGGTSVDISKSLNSIEAVSIMLKDIKYTTEKTKEKLLNLDPQLNNMKDTLEKFNNYGDDIKQLSKLSDNISELDRRIENFLIKTGAYFAVAVIGFGIISTIIKPLFAVLFTYLSKVF